jgi:glycosyltransferase involved in cell wall biosynthesis
MLDEITPLILTYNEAQNVKRTLDKLAWARRIIVVDSGSTDATLDILRTYDRVHVLVRPFVDFASQCNFGLSQVTTPWVLSLDADYELSDELITELHSLVPAETTAGYRARFVYRIYGRPLRGSLYPPRTVLYKKGQAVYKQEGHSQRVAIDGDIRELHGFIYHDDRKPIAAWFGSQQRYARAEVQYLLESPYSTLSKADKLRLAGWPAPIAVFVYTLFVKGCLLDGWPGWYYVLQRVVAELVLALEIIDRRLRNNERS